MDQLANHTKIAFDLDGTLIDGMTSSVIGDYIRRYPGKSFFIITFRTPQQAETIASELEHNDLSIDLFNKIIPMPARIAFNFDEDQRFRRNAAMPGIDQVSPDALLPGEFKLMHWKGFIANKLGATVLVDDMPMLSNLGCKKFRVALVDANHLRHDANSP